MRGESSVVELEIHLTPTNLIEGVYFHILANGPHFDDKILS